MKADRELERTLMVREKNQSLRPVVPEENSFLTSQYRTQGLGLEVHEILDIENLDVAPVGTLLALNLGESVPVEFRTGSNWFTHSFGPDDVGIYPTNATFSSRCRKGGRSLLVTLEDSLFERLVPDQRREDAMDLGELRIVSDPYLSHSLRLLATLPSPSGAFAHIYAETVATSMAAHLVARFGNHRSQLELRRDQPITGNLLARINSFIEENLANEIRLSQLAEIANLSPFYFSRVFKAATGTSPYRYVVERRLIRGMDLLRRSSAPISQIALDLGFCDQSHFTREIARRFAVTPRQIRKSR